MIDQRSDQFALGITFWELCANRRFFTGAGDLEDMRGLVEDEVPRLGELNPDVPETLDDVMRCAHGRGVLAGFDLDTPIVWEVDQRFPACPDCEDNALAGAIAAGAQFPTGDSFAPAHQGCRCLLVAADR